MFTGLIREIAIVESYSNNILKLQAKHKPKIGDSIAINGICLTVIEVYNNGFSVELSDETRSIIEESRFISKVHIEPAMQLKDRFEGHIVQGHIDCIGEIIGMSFKENATDFLIQVDKEHISYIVPKGSITIDGISLTVNDINKTTFRLTIIPHTLKNTLIQNYKIGTKVHIETDLFARYIEHILKHKNRDLDWKDIDAIQMSY